MKDLISHAYIGYSDRDATQPICQQFNVHALHPFDGLKVAIEQVMFATYLRLASDGHTTVGLRDRARQIAYSLPNQLTDTTLLHLREMYNDGLRLARTLADQPNYPILELIKPTTLFAIFNTPQIKEYIHKEYTSTMNEDFLTMFLAVFGRYINTELYPERIKYDAAIYLPSAEVFINHDPTRPRSFNEEHNKRVAVVLAPKAIGEFCLEGKPNPSLSNLIGRFNFKDYSVDDILPIFASFSLDHDKYVMTNSDTTVSDICFDLVTGSSYVPGHPAGLVCLAVDKADFIQTLCTMVQEGRLAKVESVELFGELLTKLGESPDLVNYFTQPITLISAAEAFAFRSSDFTVLVNDRFLAGMEAMDEGTEGTDEEAGSSEETEGLEEDVTEGEATGSESESADGFSSATTAEEDEKPQIDPKQMLLELAQPDESMSDYLYREMVSRRISFILKNPPENAMPNDLLMLKRWKSRWLYLASVSCLRDFLSRVSVRLSDV